LKKQKPAKFQHLENKIVADLNEQEKTVPSRKRSARHVKRLKVIFSNVTGKV
jgi:hypothetical protein